MSRRIQLVGPLSQALGARAFRVLLSAAVLGLALAGALLQTSNRPLLESICRENGVVESLTALAYVVSSGAFVYANRQYAYRNPWMWGYAVLFFLVAGEEISWGQRVFFGPHPTGALAGMNVQGEINFHNIEGIHGSIRLVGLLVVLAICYAVPLSERWIPRLGQLYARLRVPVFPLWATGIVTVAILLMAVPRLAWGQIIFEIDELGELCLAVAFVIFGGSVVESHASRTAESSRGGAMPQAQGGGS